MKSRTTYHVTLTWQDTNLPQFHQDEQTWDAAVTTASHWLKQFAGVRAIWLDDFAKRQRHVLTYGEHFTVPML